MEVGRSRNHTCLERPWGARGAPRGVSRVGEDGWAETNPRAPAEVAAARVR